MLISNRTSRLLGAGTLVLATSALASCSTVMETDKIYTPAAGVSERSADVDVLNAVIVSSDGGAGTLVATLVNNKANAPASDDDMADRLVSVGGDVTGRFTPVTIPASGSVVLATTNAAITTASSGIKVTGSFALGDFVTVVLTFVNAGEVTLEIPVVPNTEGSVFEGQDGPATPAEEPAEHDETGSGEAEDH